MTHLDLTPAEHEHSALVEQAAQWLAEQPAGSTTRPIVEIQRRFPLTAPQACEAVSLAGRMRMLRRAFG